MNLTIVVLVLFQCIGFARQGFGNGGRVRRGFCEKLLEARSFPLSDRANASQLKDRPAAGHGQAHQQWW